jgi:hypothetical protein
MKNKIRFSKGEKVFFALLLIYTAILVFVILPFYLKKQRENIYIMTPRYKIKYVKGKWKNITDSDDYKLKKFDIYVDNELLGNYKILYSTRFTLIDDNDNIVDYDGSVVAVSENIGFKLYNFTKDDYLNGDDDAVVRQALDKIGIDQTSYYNIRQKIALDIDNNGVNEYIYYVDNTPDAKEDSIDGVVSPIVDANGNNFSLLLMSKNNKIYIIDYIITDDEDYDIFEPLNLVDIRKNGKLELIYSEGKRFNTFSDCVKLYDLKSNKIIHNFCE